jgi:protein farnesyltransferase subunit beta
MDGGGGAQVKGGLRDKPGKPPDYYHTCYCLSGLSASQHSSGIILGPRGNQLVRADPLCNVVDCRLASALRRFDDLDGR